ncbi:hypothetical protein BC833DRAFT_610206 [Globomyces pollinis-pini]|nr:hypothetical protein BC833DRAFT_610206 [Globomyces pollinis-pini]
MPSGNTKAIGFDDYTYHVLISFLTTITETIGTKGVIDVLTSPAKDQIMYYIHLVIMISTIIQALVQHMIVVNTLPTYFCHPINVFSNFFWHVQFTLAETKWFYQASIYYSKNKYFKDLQRKFFAILIIGRAGVGVWDVFCSGGIFDPDLGCIYYQYPLSGIVYFSYDIFNVLISAISSTIQLYTIIKSMESSQRPTKEGSENEAPGAEIRIKASQGITKVSQIGIPKIIPKSIAVKRRPTKEKTVFGALIESSIVRSITCCCLLIPTCILCITDPSAPFLQYSFMIEIGGISLLTYYEKDMLQFLLNPFSPKTSAI